MMVVKAKPKAKPVAAKAQKKPPVRSAETWPFPTPGVSKSRVKKTTAQKKIHATSADSKKHMVMASLNNVELAKAKSALSLDLYADGKKIGNLEVGQGSFFWTGARRKKSKPIDWTRFAAMMNQFAYEPK
jgi:hypothetical protein